MTKSRLAAGSALSLLLQVGLAGVGLAGASVAVAAQEAAPQQSQAAPTPAPSCSGLGCLFAPQPQAAAAPPPATTPAEPAVVAQADDPKDKVEAKRPAAKPVHPITIAASSAEMERLKGLSAALPKTKIKLVKDDADAKATDFSVTTSLDREGGATKAKLFTEQMHIVAGSSVHELADLRDKVVSFGPDKTPGQEAARKAFEAVGVHVKETPLEIDNALDGLSTGDVAAIVVLAPQPVAELTHLKDAGLHLVSWPDQGTLPNGATLTAIDGKSYPGLAASGDEIRAVGVDAVLNVNAKGAKLPSTKAFLDALSQHSAGLSRRGFDLIKADLDSRSSHRVAAAERR